jgi:hypothetical protein
MVFRVRLLRCSEGSFVWRKETAACDDEADGSNIQCQSRVVAKLGGQIVGKVAKNVAGDCGCTPYSLLPWITWRLANSSL